MAESKKYYWLKLKKDFFKRHDIRIVEGMPNGKDYILFYLKLLVESIDHEGELRFSDTIPYNEEMLATVTNTNIDVVRAAMHIFLDLEMIEILDDKTIFMTEVSTMIGCETEWARKKREYRNGLIEDKERTKKDNARQEIEKELEIDKEIYINIVDYLNQKTGSKFRWQTEKTQKSINGRLSDGYTFDDFKYVIDVKAAEWQGTDMEKYLTPDTLFRPSNFEKYRNQKMEQKQSDVDWEAIEREYQNPTN